MSRKSRYSGLAGTLRSKKEKPSEVAAPKRVGKSKDKDNYVSTTLYILKPIHKDVSVRLTERELELSQLVEDLLVEWLNKQ